MSYHFEKIKKQTKIIKIVNWIFGLMVIEYPMGRPRCKITLFYIGFSIIIYCLFIGITYTYLNNTNNIFSYDEFGRKNFKVLALCSIVVIIIMKTSTFNRTEVSFLLSPNYIAKLHRLFK